MGNLAQRKARGILQVQQQKRKQIGIFCHPQKTKHSKNRDQPGDDERRAIPKENRHINIDCYPQFKDYVADAHDVNTPFPCQVDGACHDEQFKNLEEKKLAGCFFSLVIKKLLAYRRE